MSKYNPQTSIDLCKTPIFCDDCGEVTKSLYDVFLSRDPYSDYHQPEELTAETLNKDGGYRCINCESLNRDYIITMLYHKKHNPEIFKEQMKKDGIKDGLEEYIKN